MNPGHCSWHDGWADDVVLVHVVETGSGPGGGARACLPCARPLLARSHVPDRLHEQVAAMEARAATRDKGAAS